MELARLARDLRAHLRGEVRFDDATRALYATDGSNYRQVPLGVVRPRDVEDVIRAVEICRVYDVPVLPRGAGTSLAGQACNVAVVLDTSRYLTRVLEVDPEGRRARVEPGVVLDDLRRPIERAYGLTFGPDPSTHNRCTLGGMIGNNACGAHSILAHQAGTGPRTSDQVEELEVLLYDGTRLRLGPGRVEPVVDPAGRASAIAAALRALAATYAEEIRARFPSIPRRVSGYNLDDLLPERGEHLARALVGTEGTCAVILEATVRLVPRPRATALLVLGFPTVEAAAEATPRLLEHRPIALEGFDAAILEGMRRKGLQRDRGAPLPPGGAWLLVEFGGDHEQEARDRAAACAALAQRLGPGIHGRVCADPGEARAIWRVRESALGASAFVPGEPDTWEGWEDAAVAPDRLADYLRGLRRLLDRYGYRTALYGHFGQGCVHNRITFDLLTADGVARFRSFLQEAAELVVALGGSLSGEHGDGQARAELLEVMFGPRLVEAFRAFKAIFDPRGRMNPGKVVDPRPIAADLRLGPTYRVADPPTWLRFPADGGSFARATLRCIGVGACRKTDEGTMCPSYMATREEAHSTRGRAHLLHEMLRGEVVRGGWRSRAVHDALALCLACKACKRECPTGVDMAAYKAEFMAHHYARRLRPRAAYAFGLVPVWLRWAARAPGLARAASGWGPAQRLLRWAADVAPQRRLPRLAIRPLRLPAASGGRPVLLWADTFNRAFHPEVLEAAARVLVAAGWAPQLSPAGLCCGRPLYDWGMLARARRWLRRALTALRPSLETGTPIVVLEPSCLSVFQDELRQLFPQDPDAIRLAQQAVSLADLLERSGFTPAPSTGTVLLHPHCHRRALGDVGAEVRLLAQAGWSVELPDAGCCGMAGAFGFHKATYDVAQAVGERRLLPAVRALAPEARIVADGFSCREQIEGSTGRRVWHLAELLAEASGAANA